jgi:hypothetical protein
VVAGDTDIVAPVPIDTPFKDQLYVPPGVGELAESVPLAPLHIVIGLTLTVGPGLTVTEVVALTVPQFGTVSVTV